MVYHTKEIQEIADEIGCSFAEACKMWYEAELIYEEPENEE